MPPVIAAVSTWVATALGVCTVAGATVITGITSALVYGGAMIGINAVTNALFGPKVEKDIPSTQINVRQAVTPRWTVCGFYNRAGVVTYADTDGTAGWLYLILTLNGRQCDHLGTIYFNQTPVPVGDNGVCNAGPFKDYAKIARRNGAAEGSFAGLFGLNPQWTGAHKQIGCASLLVALKYSQDVFTSGAPNVTVDIWGHPVYDPRTGTTHWSDNPALHYRDYMITPEIEGGWGATAAEMNDAEIITAANICDELVLRSDGTYEKRYTCNGYYSWDQEPDTILSAMLSCCAGIPTYIDGKYGLIVGSYLAPDGDTLTDADVRRGGSLKLQSRTSSRDLCNGVRGQIVAREKLWKPCDYYPVIHRINPASDSWGVDNDLYLAQDNGERKWLTLNLPFTTSNSMAMRLAKIALEANRRQKALVFPGKLSCYQYVPGESAELDHERFGFHGKVFRVVESRMTVEQDANESPVLGVDLQLKEWDADVYAWSPSEERRLDEVAPPPPSVGLPSNEWILNLSVRGIPSPNYRVSRSTGAGDIESTFVDWAATVRAPSTGTVVVSLRLQSTDTEFATVTYAAGSYVGVFAGTFGSLSIEAGDAIVAVFPATADPSLEDVDIFIRVYIPDPPPYGG